MRQHFAALIACCFAVSIGTIAFAGGSSDTSGEGFHCYLFFTFNGEFSQAMVNDSDPFEVIKKAEEFIAKYVDDEGGTLDLAVGNLEGTVCEPLPEPPPPGGGIGPCPIIPGQPCSPQPLCFCQ